jgi:hypothetical protein
MLFAVVPSKCVLKSSKRYCAKEKAREWNDYTKQTEGLIAI